MGNIVNGILVESNGDRFNQYLVDPTHERRLYALADAVLAGRRIDEAADELGVTDNVMVMLAAQMARSRRQMLRVQSPHKLGIAFPMWREARRLRPFSPDNPTGEDCLNRKLDALEWLCAGTPVSYRLYGVDDGCPEDSYGIASRIAADSPLGDRVSLARLADGFPYSEAPLARLTSLEDSTKGGAVALGLSLALADGCDLLCYTDCDNSVHLGQLGNLVAPLIFEGREVAFGDRFIEGSTMFWHPGRTTETPSARTLMHVRRLLPRFKTPIKDMAQPFKAYRAPYLRSILSRMRSFDFTFDVDLALALVADDVIPALCEYTFLDSFDESAWHHHGTAAVQFQRVTGLLRAIRTHNLPHDEELATVIDAMLSNVASIARVLDTPPPGQLRDVDHSALGREETMSARELREWMASIGLPA